MIEMTLQEFLEYRKGLEHYRDFKSTYGKCDKIIYRKANTYYLVIPNNQAKMVSIQELKPGFVEALIKTLELVKGDLHEENSNKQTLC